MKNYQNFLLLIVFLSFSCSRQIMLGKYIVGQKYESEKGPLYRGNQFTFNIDSSFIFVGNGPSVFLSKGTWRYDLHNKEIILKSTQPDVKYLIPKTIDTLWVDISYKRIKVKSHKEMIFDNTIYYKK